ncbi:hypothetical protein M0P48_03280 [Candidatus Gracilibacteria bacterium]|nr:hypothetical protein [Candidatus Gracilibacteria bacterium]
MELRINPLDGYEPVNEGIGGFVAEYQDGAPPRARDKDGYLPINMGARGHRPGYDPASGSATEKDTDHDKEPKASVPPSTAEERQAAIAREIIRNGLRTQARDITQ